MTQRRYLFLCPDRTSASGGIAVIYDMVRPARAGRSRCGYSAQRGPRPGIPDYYDELPAFFTNRIRKEEWRWLGKRGRIARIGQNLAGLGCKARLRQVELRETDAIVIPEFMMAEALVAFHDQPLAVFVQNPFAFMRAYDRALQRGFDPAKRVIYWFGMSRIVERYLSLMGVRNTGFFPVSMKPQDFSVPIGQGGSHHLHAPQAAPGGAHDRQRPAPTRPAWLLPPRGARQALEDGSRGKAGREPDLHLAPEG